MDDPVERLKKLAREEVRQGRIEVATRTNGHAPPVKDKYGGDHLIDAGLTSQNGTATPAIRGLVTTCLSTITPTPVRWLIPDYLPRGKLVLLAGDGGNCKSTVTLHLAAKVTTGQPCLGLSYPAPAPADVLLITCEDGFEDTVVPRLVAAGADLQRIRRVDGVKTKDGKGAFDLSQYQALEEELQDRPGVKLIIIDPAGAYIGGRVDDHKDAALRALLGPLSDLAASQDVTVILVKHFSKGINTKAMYRVTGSVAYVNAVRMAFLVAPNPDNEDQRLLVPFKTNLGPKPSPLAYEAGSLDHDAALLALGAFPSLTADDREILADQLFRVEWKGPVSTDADTVLGSPGSKEKANKLEEAKKWIVEFLKDYAYPSEELKEAALKANIAFVTMRRAKAQLTSEGILNNSNRKDFAGTWWCGLGNRDNWKLRPNKKETHDPEEILETDETDETEPKQACSSGSSGSSGSSVSSLPTGDEDVMDPFDLIPDKSLSQ